MRWKHQGEQLPLGKEKAGYGHGREENGALGFRLRESARGGQGFCATRDYLQMLDAITCCGGNDLVARCISNRRIYVIFESITDAPSQCIQQRAHGANPISADGWK